MRLRNENPINVSSLFESLKGQKELFGLIFLQENDRIIVMAPTGLKMKSNG